MGFLGTVWIVLWIFYFAMIDQISVAKVIDRNEWSGNWSPYKEDVVFMPVSSETAIYEPQ